MSFISLEFLTNTLAPKWASSDDLLLIGVRKIWTQALPESITAHAYPSSLASGILTIAVDSPIRQREYAFLASEIRDNLNAKMSGVSGLAFNFRTVRPFEPPRLRAPIAPIPADRREVLEKKAAEITSSLPDPQKREAAYLFVLACLEEGVRLGYPGRVSGKKNG